MFSKVLKRNVYMLSLTVILVVTLSSTAVFAKKVKTDTEILPDATVVSAEPDVATSEFVYIPPESFIYPSALITVAKGGTIYIAEGAQFMVKPGALLEDTIIWAGIESTEDGSPYFIFGPHGTQFKKNLKDKPALLKVSREIFENNRGDLLLCVTEPLSADIANIQQDIALLDGQPEYVMPMNFIIAYVDTLIMKIHEAARLEQSVNEYRTGQELVPYILSLIIDLSEQGLDSVIADLESLISNLGGDIMGELTIYSEQDGEYIASYSVSDDNIVWKIPHFSIYYYRRR